MSKILSPPLDLGASFERCRDPQGLTQLNDSTCIQGFVDHQECHHLCWEREGQKMPHQLPCDLSPQQDMSEDLHLEDGGFGKTEVCVI